MSSSVLNAVILSRPRSTPLPTPYTIYSIQFIYTLLYIVAQYIVSAYVYITIYSIYYMLYRRCLYRTTCCMCPIYCIMPIFPVLYIVSHAVFRVSPTKIQHLVYPYFYRTICCYALTTYSTPYYILYLILLLLLFIYYILYFMSTCPASPFAQYLHTHIIVHATTACSF